MNVPIKRGMLLKHQSRFFFVDEITDRHSGKQKPTIHVSLHDAHDGHHVDRTIDELLPIEEVTPKYRQMQYLYAKGEHHYFMDSESFEESDLGKPQLHGCEPFLKEGEQFRVMFVGDQPLKLDMPDIVQIKVADTAAPSHAAGAASNILKEARLENGLELRVPLFVKTGDTIQVDTRSKAYVGKGKEK